MVGFSIGYVFRDPSEGTKLNDEKRGDIYHPTKRSESAPHSTTSLIGVLEPGSIRRFAENVGMVFTETFEF